MPDPRSRKWQEFCSKAECRKASKAARQRRWVAKNRDYWRGREHVERVRAWRKANPGYSKRRRDRAKAALQDGWEDEQIPCSAGNQPLGRAALQDGWMPKDPLLVGLIAVVAKGALQGDIAKACRSLIAKGREILAARVGGLGV